MTAINERVYPDEWIKWMCTDGIEARARSPPARGPSGPTLFETVAVPPG